MNLCSNGVLSDVLSGKITGGVLVLRWVVFRLDHGERWGPALQMLAWVPLGTQWVRVANAYQFKGTSLIFEEIEPTHCFLAN